MTITDPNRPKKLIAELSREYQSALKDRGPVLWSEIASTMRHAAACGAEQIEVTVPQDLGSFIESRLRDATLTFTSNGPIWTIRGWSEWVDPEAKK